MPGLMSASLKISTFPVLGRTGADSGAGAAKTDVHASATEWAANFMGPSLTTKDTVLGTSVPIMIYFIERGFRAASQEERPQEGARRHNRCPNGGRRRDLCGM